MTKSLPREGNERISMQKRLRSAFEDAVASGIVPGVAAIVLDRDGQELFKGTFGTTCVGDASAPTMSPDTPLMMWSCTKLVTTVAALQLIEQGKLALYDPIEKHVPSFGKLQVYEGLKDGKPILRAPKTTATVLHLLTHTVGFSYDWLDQPTADWRTSIGQNLTEYVVVAARYCFDQPLMFDPGTSYKYGISTDWLGFVIEAVTGNTLDEYIDKNILQPLGMRNTGWHLKPGQTKLAVHFRSAANRTLAGNSALGPAENPEVHGGGTYLYSTLNDYSTFLLTVLNYGKHPTLGVRILEEATARNYIFTDQIDKICSNKGVGIVDSANPVLSVKGELLPGVDKGFSCGLVMSRSDSANGRPKGSGGWAAMGNAYYWLDPVQGKMGFIASSILPFMDAEVLHHFDEVERAVYGHEPAKTPGEAGSNFSLDSAA